MKARREKRRNPDVRAAAADRNSDSKTLTTLDRVLSRFGIASRAAAREAIRAGRLKVNGKIVRNPECWVRPDREAIHLDGQRLKPARKVYIAFYKPNGVITSHGDPQGRKTVYDFLHGHSSSNVSASSKFPAQWIFPVGRLDQDSSGLLLLTNDTAFADFVASPESRIPKTYQVKVNGILPDDVIERLSAGVEMKRGDWARPLSVRRIEDRGKYTRLEVTLAEGKNREVRRMLEAVGFKALKLVRTQIGPLTLEGLEVGKWRALRPDEAASMVPRRRDPRGRRWAGTRPAPTRPRTESPQIRAD
ncbi:MAG: pseudouridine synthase [Terriglobia bacterium]